MRHQVRWRAYAFIVPACKKFALPKNFTTERIRGRRMGKACQTVTGDRAQGLVTRPASWCAWGWFWYLWFPAISPASTASPFHGVRGERMSNFCLGELSMGRKEEGGKSARFCGRGLVESKFMPWFGRELGQMECHSVFERCRHPSWPFLR